MPRPQEPPADREDLDTLAADLQDLAAEQAAADAAEDAVSDQEAEKESTTVTVQPARLWPVYNEDRAHRELLAMEMITKGASYRRVRAVTKLSPKNVRRLISLVAEEARSPVVVRNVCRNPIHEGMPGYHGVPRQRAGTPETGSSDGSAQSEQDEPLQMALAFDC
ncbi:hypothetical protein PV726_31805 [Streptomyces europaeiscabiei]|uniref:hypothetical protein n=1 Tax=Streptomyces europaeiscabiei TaxID=146819 RepID=UPI0029BEF063|nr:hypothetical protein [Streptomyces europaeiscabiei]MDX3694840.1 hypothetical protein [Streptomyces europaeiscabiei]